MQLVKAFLKAGIMNELGVTSYTHTGTPQGGILSPLLANVALSVLDEHLQAPWWPGGKMSTVSRRERLRKKGQPTYKVTRYADDFVVLVNGSRADTVALREEIAGVLQPMGLTLSAAKTHITHMSEGFDFLGFHIQWRLKQGSNKRHVYTFISHRAIRSIKMRVRALTPRTSQRELSALLTRINQVMHGWANYFKHAVAKTTFSMISYFAWWRIINLLRYRHHWGWRQLRRQFRTRHGTWLPIRSDAVEYLPISTIPVTRYRYRGYSIPTPWAVAS